MNSGGLSGVGQAARRQRKCAKAAHPSHTRTRVISAPDPYSNLSEHSVQCALFKAYSVRGLPNTAMFAIPNGGARDVVTGKLLRDEGVTPGAPDIFVCVNGRVVLIEVKVSGGALSKAQKEYHPKLREAGCEVHVVYGFLEGITLLENLGVVGPPKGKIHEKIECGELGGNEEKAGANKQAKAAKGRRVSRGAL